MRNIATCYSQHAIKVSDSYCSGPSNQPFESQNYSIPSIQNAVTSIYKAKISTQTHFLIKLKWCKLGFSIAIFNSKLCKYFRVSQKTNGSKSFESNDLRFEVSWDLSKAEYDNVGLEPVSGFYIIVLINSETCLVLGDKENDDHEPMKMMKNFGLISRIEGFSGTHYVYSTKVKFDEKGSYHDILIKFSGEDGGGVKNLMLSVDIDKKNVIQVKRLQWNFRGNQTIFVDGLLVDMMWDVYNLFFNSSMSSDEAAVFLFKTRNGFDSRLWFEEKNLEMIECEDIGFSLLIYVCKNTC